MRAHRAPWDGASDTEVREAVAIVIDAWLTAAGFQEVAALDEVAR